MTDKMELSKFKDLCSPEIESLILRIEGAARDRGIKLADEWVGEKLWDLIEDIHIEKFITKKLRKAGKWLKSRGRKIRKWFKFK